MSKVYDYNDLNFKIIHDGETLSARQKFANGYEISVVTSLKYPRGTAYGEAFKETFECALFNPNNDYVPLNAYDDVLAFQTKGEISSVMIRCQAYGKEWEDKLVKEKMEARNQI